MEDIPVYPPVRRISLTPEGITIHSLGAEHKSQSPWTEAAIPLPQGVKPNSFRVRAARATEWCTDLLITHNEARTGPEVWRLGPRRIRGILSLRLPGGGMPQLQGAIHPTENGFVDVLSNGHAVVIDIPPTDFSVTVRQEFRSPHAFDFFISYKHDREDQARSIVDGLERHGHRVWFDRRELLGEFNPEILEGISSSRMFVVLWSERSGEDGGRNDGNNIRMSQATEIQHIHRSLEGNSDQSLFIYHLDGAAPDSGITKDRYHTTDSKDLDLDRFIERLHQAATRHVNRQ